MDTFTSNTKIKLLQQQVAILSLTVASITSQMKHLECEVESLKKEMKRGVRPIMVYEPDENDFSRAQSSLSIDDSASDGYDTDDAITRMPKIKTKTPIKKSNQYVLVSEDGNESGYEDSESETSTCSNERSFVPVYEDARLNPFDNERITQELQSRALILEEL